jgi:hypothetical protein
MVVSGSVCVMNYECHVVCKFAVQINKIAVLCLYLLFISFFFTASCIIEYHCQEYK